MRTVLGSADKPTSSLQGWLARLALPSAAVAVGGVGTWLLGRVQRGQVFAPVRYPDGMWQPRAYGLPAEDVWFEADDGTRLHAWWIPHPKARGAVLYCHGNNGNISHRLGALGDLRRMKVSVLAFDYRGYGRSEGEPSEDGVYRDARAAWDHLTGPLGVEPSKVLLFGHSLGGAVAIETALHRQIAGLVVQSSFTHIRDMVRVLYPRTPLHLMARNQFRSLDKVASIDVPKLFIHGSDDPTIPMRLGRRLYEAAAEPKDWFEIPRAGHNDVYRHGGFRYYWRLARFAKKCLTSS
ncbi:MAG: alpha/beta hydrolase [Acidobacteriota bacterium]|nr:alpha/beta hydrolase [Acidobacteriota bacterium]